MSKKNRTKIFRITTIPASLKILLKGQLRFMGSNGFEMVAVSSDESQLYELQKEENVKIFPIKMTRKITPYDDLLAIWNLYKILKSEKPKIVHTHTPKAGLVGMTASYFANVPIRLHTVAGLPLMESKGIKRKILNFVEKITYSFSTKIYPNSKGLYEFILDNNFTTRKKLMVLGNGSSNGINTNFFSKSNITEVEILDLKRYHNINDNDFVFVFVGRLVGDKGINELIEAFSQLTIHNARLLLVGPLESDLDPLLSETLKEIETNPNVISVGFQKDVRPYFAISDALVFPSYREGFPNVVMQAGAMGLPSIVSNINGCNEIIIEGENGLIIPVKDSEAIQSAMLKMIEDKEFYLKLKGNSRSMIQSRYEQSVVWQALLEEYTQLLKEKKLNV